VQPTPSFPGCAALHPGDGVFSSVAAATMDSRRRGNDDEAWRGDGPHTQHVGRISAEGASSAKRRRVTPAVNPRYEAPE